MSGIHMRKELTTPHIDTMSTSNCISENNNNKDVIVWIFKRAARQRLHETRFSLTVTFTLSGFESVDVVVARAKIIIKEKPFKLNERDLRPEEI
jgi:hypothetical protein